MKASRRASIRFLVRVFRRPIRGLRRKRLSSKPTSHRSRTHRTLLRHVAFLQRFIGQRGVPRHANRGGISFSGGLPPLTMSFVSIALRRRPERPDKTLIVRRCAPLSSNFSVCIFLQQKAPCMALVFRAALCDRTPPNNDLTPRCVTKSRVPSCSQCGHAMLMVRGASFRFVPFSLRTWRGIRQPKRSR